MEESKVGRGRNNLSFQRREVASKRRDRAMDIKPSVWGKMRLQAPIGTTE